MSSSTATTAPRHPVVICVAPNGARRTRVDHPRLPMTEAELAAEAAACADAGAALLHLHVRDALGDHSLDVGRYRRAIDAIREAVGDRLLIQVTTEAVGRYTPAQQRELLQTLRPSYASVALRELVPDARHEQEAQRLFHWAHADGVALQFILYTPDEARRLRELVRTGVIAQPRPNVLFVLGRYTQGQQSTPRDLLPFLDGWPDDWPWSVCAFGAAEALCMSAAVALGGHVRVGFENNLWTPDGQVAADNAALVCNVRQLARCAGRPHADVNYARRVYGAGA